MDRITQDKINDRAVKIAAKIMQQAGMCRYGSASKCRKVYPPSTADCAGCIKRFLLGMAKKQLEREERGK